ncbi:MAG: hypothetical protein NVS2B14_06040 [Chamaesiphon sp.]
MMNCNPYIGSSFDELLEEEVMLADIETTMRNRVIAWQIEQATSREIDVGAGTGVVRTYAEWQALFRSPEVGGVLGIDHLFTQD